MNCDFCESEDVKRRTIIKDDKAFAFLTHIPLTKGHMIVCPLRHVLTYEEMTDEEKSATEEMRLKIKGILIKVFGAEGFNYAWNEQKIAGQSISHFHLHIVPRKKGDTEVLKFEPREFLYGSVPRNKSPEEELLEVVELVKKNL